MGWRYTLGELASAIGAQIPAAADTPFGSISTDTRTLQPGDVFFALRGENFDGNRFMDDAFARGAVAAVCNEARATAPCLVVDDTLVALGRFGRWHRDHFDIPMVGITGSVGKTTTKEMVAEVLDTRMRTIKSLGNFNNDIGCPLSLMQLDHEVECMVIELGCSQPGDIARLCEIAAPTESMVTVVGEAHLEGLGTIENVAKTKAEIMEALPEGGRFYVNLDDPWCRRIGEQHRGPARTIGSGGDVHVRTHRVLPTGDMEFDIHPIGVLRLPLAVPEHVTSVLFAVAVGLEYGITTFERPLRHACENALRFRVLRCGTVEILDDSYNANPPSMRSSLHALSLRTIAGPRIAALGDMLELGDDAETMHEALGRAVPGYGVTHLYAMGDFADAIVRGAQAAGLEEADVCASVEALEDAVDSASRGTGAVLVKGSRGARMERLVANLQARFGTGGVAQSTSH